jgi:AAA domain
MNDVMMTTEAQADVVAKAGAFLVAGVGTDGSISGDTIIEMTVMLCGAGLKKEEVRRVARDLCFQLRFSGPEVEKCIEVGLEKGAQHRGKNGASAPPAARADKRDLAGVEVSSASARGLDGAEQPAAAGNGHDAHHEDELEEEPALEQDLEPRHPLLVGYAREISIADKDRKADAWRHCCAKTDAAIRKGLVKWEDVSDGLIKLADSHSVFGLFSREKAEAEECWRNLPHEADPAPAPSPPATSKGAGKPYVYVLARDITIEANLKVCLIDGFLGRHEQSAWYGAPESGKSTAIIDAACRVASGQLYCDRVVMQGAVLYVAAERGMNVRRRILAWRLEHGIDDFPLAMIDDAVDLRTGAVDTDRIIDAAQRLADECKQPVVWIIFDTLSRVLAGGDENSPRDMGALVASVDRIFRRTGAHCSLVHHTPLGESDRMRGHTSFNGAMDTTVRIEKRNGIVALEVVKASDLPDAEKPKLFFRFKPVTLTSDPDTTASILIQADDQAAEMAAASGKGKGKKETKTARIFREAFIEALDTPGPDIRVRTDGQKAVDVQAVRRAFTVRYITGEAEPKKRADATRKAFRRVLRDLPAPFATENREGREWIWSTQQATNGHNAYPTAAE